ncbi:MAG: acyl-CoA desaturase [Pseudobacteriovorax sp.]|nr:acyl-CoA desaturase [Pseudobacteriovorax sp.]
MQSFIQPKLTLELGRTYMKKIRAECQKQALEVSSPSVFLGKLFLFSATLLLLMILSWQSSSVAVWVLLSIAMSLVLSQLAFIGHDAGHNAIPGGNGVNQFFGSTAMTLLCGLAFNEWKARHRAHHQYCQQEEKDPDMAIESVASVTRDSYLDKSAFFRWIGKFQYIYLWFLALAFGHSQRHLSQWGAITHLRSFKLDNFMILLHYTMWLFIPLGLGVEPLTVFATYLIPVTILGLHLASIFWINHIGMPLYSNKLDVSNFERQVVCSRTVSNPRWMDWFFGGLNYQIEHHLIPSIPSCNLNKLQSIVKPIVKSSGLPYTNPSWKQTMIEIKSHFYHVAR